MMVAEFCGRKGFVIMLKKLVCKILCLYMLLSLLPSVVTVQAATQIVASGSYTGGVKAEQGLMAVFNVVLTGDGLELDGTARDKERVGFDLDRNLKFEVGKNYYAEIGYKDEGGGFFYLEYSGANGEIVTTDYVCLLGTGADKTEVLPLPTPNFNGINGDVDFWISTAVNWSTVQNYSETPVYINSVKIYSDGTYSDADVTAESANPGNIFYTGENAEFKVVVKNLQGSPQSLNLTYNVYLLSNDDQRRLLETRRDYVDIPGGEKALRSYTAQADWYGRYILEILAEGGSRGTYVKKEFEFSRCVYNTNVSDTFGVNTHTSQERGDADTIFPLMRNAGIVLTRETMNWESYESVPGVRALTAPYKNALLAMRKYGIEPIIIIYGNNRAYEVGSDFVSPANMENYKSYIRSFISEPEMEFVKDVEIYNEPDIKTGYLGENISANEELKGQLYAAMAEAGYEAVKDTRPDMNVESLSFCRITNTVSTSGFLRGVMTSMKEYTTKTGVRPFDTISLHAYIGEINPESGFNGSNNTYCEYHKKYHGSLYLVSLQGMIEYWQNYIESLSGFKAEDYTIALTEYGTSNSLYGEYYQPTEHRQAVMDLRSYFAVKAEAFSQKNYVYDFMDDGLRRNTAEHNYGMIRNESYRVPYAAKASYLSAAAMNHFLNGTVSAEFVYSNTSTDYHNVLRFTGPEREVYALWTTNKNGGSVAYDFPNDVNFYDMYGNIIDIEDITDASGNYILTDEPYYAVTGKQMEFASKDVSNSIYLTGSIASGKGNVRISLTVLPQEAEFGGNMAGQIVYLDQSRTYSDGVFSFHLKGLEHGRSYTAYIVPEDGGIPVNINFSDTAYPKYLRLYSEDLEITSVNLNLLDLQNASIEINFDETWESADYKLICSFFQNGILQHAEIKNGSYRKGSDTLVQTVPLSIDREIKYDQIKLMLWNDTDEMKPICDATVL